MINSAFPQLLAYGSVAPLIIRIVLALVFIHFGRNKMRYPITKTTKVLSVIEIVLGVLVFVGLFTQLAATLIAAIMLVQLLHKILNKKFLTDGVNYYLVIFVMALSLVFSGAGALAFDTM